MRAARPAAAAVHVPRARTPPVARRPATAVGAGVGFLGSPSFAVTWTWDAASGTWKRSIFGSPEIVASGVQFAPKNVVVMFVPYVGGDPNHANEGAEAVITGHRPRARVHRRARRSRARGRGPTRASPRSCSTRPARSIPLTPGQTWVELPDTELLGDENSVAGPRTGTL